LNETEVLRAKRAGSQAWFTIRATPSLCAEQTREGNYLTRPDLNPGRRTT